MDERNNKIILFEKSRSEVRSKLKRRNCMAYTSTDGRII